MFTKLQTWQDQHRVDDAALAKRLGCSRQTIQRLKKAESTPRRPTLEKLKRLTGVTPTDCAAHFEEMAERRLSAAQPSMTEAGAL